MLLASQINFEFPPLDGVGLRSMMPLASDSAIDLISSLCSWDPSKRPSAAQALKHPFFNVAGFSSYTRTLNKAVLKIKKLSMMQPIRARSLKRQSFKVTRSLAICQGLQKTKSLGCTQGLGIFCAYESNFPNS